MSETPFMPLWFSDFLGDTLELDAKGLEFSAWIRMVALEAARKQKGD